MNTRYYYLLIIVILFGCSSEEESQRSLKLNKGYSAKIDTLLVNPSQSSQVGYFHFKNDTIYYIDRLFGFVESFDLKGNRIDKHLQTMTGPEELGSIQSLTSSPEGFIVRSEWMYYQYDHNWQFIQKKVLNTNDGTSYEDLVNNPKATQSGIYEIQYYNEKNRISPDGYILVKLDVEHPKFNAFSTRAFYREAFLLGKVNPNSGALQQMIGKRPESYEQYSYVPFHSFFDYELYDGGYLFTYDIDPVIYQHDASFKIIDQFGEPGIDMNQNYEETNRIEAAFDSDKFSASRKNDGYYLNVYADESRDLVFRTYRQGSTKTDLQSEDENPLRLQIYHQKKLIDDIAVPGRFKIIGKSGDTYIADGFFDEMNEKQGVYQLKIQTDEN